MLDDQNNSNPLNHKIETIEELVKDTQAELGEATRALQEAEESGNLEEFLKSHQEEKK
jgi:hypothetical protein